jgi:hypothetical protein
MSAVKESTTPIAPPTRRLFLVTLRFALALGALAYIGVIAYRDFPRVVALVLPFSVERAAWLTLCTLLLAAGPFFSVAVFRILATRYRAESVPYRELLGLLLLANLLRYLPGRFFGVAYQVSSRPGGLDGNSVFRLNVEQLVSSLVGNTLAASGMLAFAGGRPLLGGVLLAATLPTTALILRVRMPRAGDARPLSPRARWTIALLNLLSLVPYLLAWHFLGHVFPALASEPLVALGASYLVAWAAGVIVFVTPGGLGVREAVFLLLSPPAAREALALLALFARVWHLFADLCAWLLGTLVPAVFRPRVGKA